MAAAITEAMRGWPGCFGVGVESTWATAVAFTRWLPYFRNTFQAKEVVEKVPYMATINSSQTSHVGNTSVVTAHDVAGEIETALRYDCKATAMMLAAFFGAAPATTGAGPYTHTYSLAAAAGLSLTGQNVHGSHSAIDRGEIIPGVVLTGLEISWSGRGLVRVKYRGIAWKSNGHAAISGTVTIEDANEVLASHLAALSWNSLSLQIKSGTLTVERGLVARPNAGNGLYTDKPAPNGETEITLKVKLDWTTHALETARAAGTRSDAVLTFTGAGNNTATFTIDGAQIVDLTKDDGSQHIREQDVEFRGHFVDATNLGFKAVLVNDNASAYA